MSIQHDITSATLGLTVAAGGSFTINYPAGKAADDYYGGTDHQIVTHSAQTLFAKSGDFALSFGAANITVTLAVGRAMAQGTLVFLHLDRASREAQEIELLADNVMPLAPYLVNLGKPIAANATAIVAAQAATAAGGLAAGINGAQAANGAVTLLTARNIVAAWTGAAVLTVTGEDEFGQPMRESSAAGTSFTGKKAFKKVTGLAVSANVTGLTVGTGNVLGLPFFLSATHFVRQELQDDATASAGTVVAGDDADATATTGDVRGTYTPNAAPDGAKRFELVIVSRSGSFKGKKQF